MGTDPGLAPLCYFCGSATRKGQLCPESWPHTQWEPWSLLPRPTHVYFDMYRWHIQDPIYFENDLRVTIQALGWRSEKRYLPLQDDISSVAYWYSDNLDDVYPTLPDANGLELI